MTTLPEKRPIRWLHVGLGFAAGVVALLLLEAVSLWLAHSYGAGETMHNRQEETQGELLAERSLHQAAAHDRSAEHRQRLVETVHAIQQTNPNYTVDFLILSGGGDKGAFASGFLRGWASVTQGPLARPVFEGVSGVSTGGLIAPSAFLGTPEDAIVINELFRSPMPDWVLPRGVLFFHPQNSSLAHIPGLVRELDSYIDLPLAQRLVDAGAGGRSLVVQATDADEGTSHTFDLVAAARRAVESGDLAPLRTALLATSAVPGVFPPQQMDGDLYIDGISTGNIFYGFYSGIVVQPETFGSMWRSRYPDSPIPKIRYWVIINNTIKAPAQTVQPRWLPVAQRGLEVATRSFTEVTLRHLFLVAEVTRLRGEGECEVRWVAVPPDWEPPTNEQFSAEKMQSLSELGRRMGEDPNSWNTESPQNWPGQTLCLSFTQLSHLTTQVWQY